ncbi:MAG: RDD family protein [Pseudomonadota bacterium]
MTERFEIDTATGVGMRLNVAGPGARSYAFVVDWHIRILLVLAWFALGSLLLLGGISLPEEGDTQRGLYTFAILLPTGVIYFLYHPILEILMGGTTPGKRLAGVRIVTLEGESPSVLAHIIRNVLRLIDSLPTAYAIGLVATVATRNSVRIGDLAAGTVLIYEANADAGDVSSVPVKPAAIKRYGLARAELAQDLLDRWDALQDTERNALATRLIPALDESIKPATDAAALKNQLSDLMSAPGDRR